MKRGQYNSYQALYYQDWWKTKIVQNQQRKPEKKIQPLINDSCSKQNMYIYEEGARVRWCLCENGVFPVRFDFGDRSTRTQFALMHAAARR